MSCSQINWERLDHRRQEHAPMAFMFDSTRLNELYQRNFNLECKHVLTRNNSNTCSIFGLYWKLVIVLCAGFSCILKPGNQANTESAKTYSNISVKLCASQLMTRQLNSWTLLEIMLEAFSFCKWVNFTNLQLFEIAWGEIKCTLLLSRICRLFLELGIWRQCTLKKGTLCIWTGRLILRESRGDT